MKLATFKVGVLVQNIAIRRRNTYKMKMENNQSRFLNKQIFELNDRSLYFYSHPFNSIRAYSLSIISTIDSSTVVITLLSQKTPWMVKWKNHFYQFELYPTYIPFYHACERKSMDFWENCLRYRQTLMFEAPIKLITKIEWLSWKTYIKLYLFS